MRPRFTLKRIFATIFLLCVVLAYSSNLDKAQRCALLDAVAFGGLFWTTLGLVLFACGQAVNLAARLVKWLVTRKPP